MIGRVVGNTYRIVGQLGEGGMGTVYRALDEALEREVAVKVVRPDLAREREIAERFRLEARTLAKVQHPAIATIHSFLQEGDELFLILELVRGRTLSQALRDDGPFSWRQAVALLAPALDGIEAAHRLGIVHRDLKPDNLMVTEDGRLKVMDFGIARAVGSSHLTRTGLLVGTLRYVAPEQIRGEEVDRRTDIYSLGIVLYEMLTGRVPFEGGNDYAILRAQIEDPPTPPGNHVAGLPPWLDQAVLRALAKDRADRFPTAEEMRSFLLSQGAPAAAGDPLDATLQLREEPGRTLPRAAVPAPPPRSEETSEIPGPAAPSPPTVATGGGAPTTRTSAPPPPPPMPLAAPAVPVSPGPAPAATPSSYHPVRLDRSGPKAGRLALVALILLIGAGVGASLLLRRTDSEPEAAEPTPAAATAPSPAGSGEVPTASVPASPAAPVAVPETEPEPEPAAASPAPSRTPSPRTSAPRETPRPAAEEPEPTAPAPVQTETAPSSAPYQAPAEAEETSPAGGTGEVPLDELRRLSGELADGTARLFTAFQGYLEKKSDADQEITGDDEQLEEDLEALQSTAERFNGSFQNGMMSRLRRMGRSGTDIEQLRRKLAKLDERGNRVESLIGRVQPGAEVQQEWQGVRRRWKRVGQILAAR